MDGGLWGGVFPCRPCVQGGRGGPLRLYGVPLVVSAAGDEDVGGCQFVHLDGLGVVVGDGDLGGVFLAVGGVGDDLVGRQFIVGDLFCCVEFESGTKRCWRRGFVLGFRLRRYFGFDQVLRVSGLWGPHLDGCRCRGSEDRGMRVSWS